MKSFKIVDRNTKKWVHTVEFPHRNSRGWTYSSGPVDSFASNHAISFPSYEAAREAMLNPIYDDYRTTMEIVEIPIFRLSCSESKFEWESIEAKTAESAINKYYNDSIRIHDADTCGDFKMSFWTISPTGEERFWNASYSWYIDYTPEWTLIDNLELEECSKEDMKLPMVADRDWLRL
jgi:hypothetical protein